MANEFYTIQKDGRTRTIEVTQEKKEEFLKKYKDNNPTLTHIGNDEFKVDVSTGKVENRHIQETEIDTEPTLSMPEASVATDKNTEYAMSITPLPKSHSISKTDGSQTKDLDTLDVYSLFDNKSEKSKNFLKEVLDGEATYNIDPSDESLVNYTQTQLETYDYLNNKGHLWPTSVFSNERLPDGRLVVNTDEWLRWSAEQLPGIMEDPDYFKNHVAAVEEFMPSTMDFKLNDPSWGSFFGHEFFIPQRWIAKKVYDNIAPIARTHPMIAYMADPDGAKKVFNDGVAWTMRHVLGVESMISTMEDDAIEDKYKLPENFQFLDMNGLELSHGEGRGAFNTPGSYISAGDDVGRMGDSSDRLNKSRGEQIQIFQEAFPDIDLSSHLIEDGNYSDGQLSSLSETVVDQYQQYFDTQFAVNGMESFITFEKANTGLFKQYDGIRVKIGNQRVGTRFDLTTNVRSKATLDPMTLEAIKFHIQLELNPKFKRAWQEFERQQYKDNPDLLAAASAGRSAINEGTFYNQLNSLQGLDLGSDLTGSGARIYRRSIAADTELDPEAEPTPEWTEEKEVGGHDWAFSRAWFTNIIHDDEHVIENYGFRVFEYDLNGDGVAEKHMVPYTYSYKNRMALTDPAFGMVHAENKLDEQVMILEELADSNIANKQERHQDGFNKFKDQNVEYTARVMKREPRKLWEYRKRIEFINETGKDWVDLNDDNVITKNELITLSKEEKEKRLAILKKDRDNFVSKNNIKDLLDKNGNFIAYSRQWVLDPNSSEENPMLMEVGKDGEPTGKTMAYDISYDEDAILQVATENDQDELYLALLEAAGDVRYLSKLVYNNLDQVSSEYPWWEDAFERGDIADIPSESWESVVKQIETIIETGSPYDIAGDGSDVFTKVGGNSYEGKALNDAMIRFRLLNKAINLNVDPYDMYRESILTNGVNSLTQAFFRDDWVTTDGGEYSLSDERDVWQELIKQKQFVRTQDRRQGDSNWGEAFWTDNAYRHMTDLTNDVVSGLAPLVAEIYCFNLAGVAMTGTKTVVSMTKRTQSMLHAIKRIGLKPFRSGKLGKNVAKKAKKIQQSKGLNKVINTIVAPAIVTPIEWAAAEQLEFGGMESHTLHTDRETGETHFNYAFPMFMGIGGGVWGSILRPGLSNAINKSIASKTWKIGGRERPNPLGWLYIKATGGGKWSQKLYAQKTTHKYVPGKEVMKWVGDKVGHGATAAGLLQFASTADQMRKDFASGEWVNHDWMPDSIKNLDPNSDRYKEWAAEWEEISLLGSKGWDNFISVFLGMTMMGMKSGLWKSYAKDILRANRDTPLTKKYAESLGIQKNKRKNDTYRERDINQAADKKINKLKNKLNKTKDKNKRKDLNKEIAKIEEARRELLIRNKLIWAQDNAKRISSKEYQKELRRQYDVIDMIHGPLTPAKLRLLAEMDLETLENYMQERRLTTDQKISIMNLWRVNKVNEFKLRKIFGREKHKLREDFLQNQFEIAQIEQKIRDAEKQIKNIKNSNKKKGYSVDGFSARESHLKNLKLKLKELEGKEKEIKEKLVKEYNRRVKDQLIIDKAHTKDIKNIENFKVVEDLKEYEALKKKHNIEGEGEAFIITGENGKKTIIISPTLAVKYKTLGAGGHEIGHEAIWGHIMEEYVKKDGTPGIRVSKEGIEIVDAFKRLVERISKKDFKELESAIELNYKYEQELIVNPKTNKLEWVNKIDPKTKKPIEKKKEDYYDEYITVFGSLLKDGIIKGREYTMKREFTNMFQGMITKLPMFKDAYGLEINGKDSRKAAEDILRVIEDINTPGYGGGMTVAVKSALKSSAAKQAKWVNVESRDGRSSSSAFRRDLINELEGTNPNIKRTTLDIVEGNNKITDAIYEFRDGYNKANPNNKITLKQAKDQATVMWEHPIMEFNEAGQLVHQKNSAGELMYSKPRTTPISEALMLNNMRLVSALSKKAAVRGETIELEAGKKVSYEDFQSGYMAELGELIRTWEVEVNKKHIPFGAYMNKILPKRYGQILEQAKGAQPIEGALGSITDATGKTIDVIDQGPGIEGTIDVRDATAKKVNEIITSELLRKVIPASGKMSIEFKKNLESAVADAISTTKGDITKQQYYDKIYKAVEKVMRTYSKEITGSAADVPRFIEQNGALIFKSFDVKMLLDMQSQMKGELLKGVEKPFVRVVKRLTTIEDINRHINLPESHPHKLPPSARFKSEAGVAIYEKQSIEKALPYLIQYFSLTSSTKYTRATKLADNITKTLTKDAFMEIRQREAVEEKRKEIKEADANDMIKNELELMSLEIGRSMGQRLSSSKRGFEELEYTDITEAGELLRKFYKKGMEEVVEFINGEWHVIGGTGKQPSQFTIRRAIDSWVNKGIQTEKGEYYKSAIRNSKEGEFFKEWKDQYLADGKFHKSNVDLMEKYAKEVLDITLEIGKDVLTAKQLSAFWNVVGFHNRLLDAAKIKNSTGKPGPYEKLFRKCKSEINKLKSDPKLKKIVENVELMNKSFGLFKRIDEIQRMNIKVEGKDGKLELLKELEPRIEKANAANIELHKILVKNLILAVKNNKISGTAVMHMMQGQTNLIAGFRALSRLDMIDLKDGSQAVYRYKKDGKWVYTNDTGPGFFVKGEYTNAKGEIKQGRNGEVNMENPLLKDAIRFYQNQGVSVTKAGKETGGGQYLPSGKPNQNWRKLTKQEAFEIAVENLLTKGEHLGPSSNTNLAIVKLMSDVYTGKVSIESIDMELDRVLEGHSQFYTSKFVADIIDLGGKTNNTNFHRIKLLDKYGFGKYINSIYSPGGKSYQEIMITKETNKWKLDNLRKAIEFKGRHKQNESLAQTTRNSISGKRRGMSTFDFDDTMAYTKSGVRTTVPNTDGLPKPSRKVIFLAGGAGSGKSNVVKKLGLEEQGFKIVNQDISLEWLKKNHGLPENMRELTKEQRSILGKLGHQARGIAKRKMMKFQGNADGIVVDGTGASKKNMEKLVNEFKDKGYDVSMLFVETTLKTALARNAARKERSLLDIIVRKNHESVQGNKLDFKNLFGERFMEIKTDNLTMESPMPMELVSKMNDFVRSYEKLRLDAAEFAAQGDAILKKGGKFDFSEFEQVVEGTEGPYLQKAIERAKKFGTKDLFVLTARPVESAKAIQEFLKSQGLDISIENITGLANSSANAKAKWMLEKFAEGYNDMYFVDDALPNVEAVKKVLDQLDVKSKVVQAKARFSNSMNRNFNEILERQSKLPADKIVSLQEAKLMGRGKGRFDYFVPPSAEDFKGLIYKMLGKGRQGDADMKFFKKALMDPFAKSTRDLTIVKQKMSEEYKTLKKQYKKDFDLNENVEGTIHTKDAAVRAYLWEKAGFEVPGISKVELEMLTSHVKNNPNLMAFAESLSAITRLKEGYSAPSEYWMVESIASDLNFMVGQGGRKNFFAEWIENKNIIFSKDNLNKIEAIHGKYYREALENILWRMETGRNRMTNTGDSITNNWYDWINGSVGATMFWNVRSAMLQTISTVNFTNHMENNIFAQAKAFANQKQFWKDFAFIMNSPMLKQRRAGLQIDVSANELTNVFEKSGKNPKAILQWLLQKGFTPTRIADSFAIAFGGAPYYRNRINMYLKQGLSEAKAKEKAWLDFQEIAEETQQSSRPDLISQQQAGPLGRIILPWHNTPMQMTRLMKKALSDLVNRRRTEGHKTQWQSDRANISRILYYGAMQNLWFYTLQSGLGWLLFGSDQEEMIEKKELQVVNGAFDTLLRGTGIYGASVSTLKNVILQYRKEMAKDWGKDDFGNVVIEAINLSPPIGAKARKLYGAHKTWHYNEGVSGELGFRIENPNIHATANVIEALFNVPLARLVNKANNLEEAISGDHYWWQRAAMTLGWNRWNVGARDEELDIAKEKAYEKRKIENQIKREKEKEEQKKQEIEEKKSQGLLHKRCGATNSKGKRCSIMVWVKKGKAARCGYHTSYKPNEGSDRDNDGIKEYQCKATTSSGNRCKNRTEHKSKKCYAHR